MVLVVLAITFGVAVPAWVSFGESTTKRPVDELLAVLRAARQAALENGVPVALAVDTKTWRYRADTLGKAGSGTLAEGQLALSDPEALQADSLRLFYLFEPSGAAMADSARVRSGPDPMVVFVDPWSGRPRAESR